MMVFPERRSLNYLISEILLRQMNWWFCQKVVNTETDPEDPIFDSDV